MIKLQQRPLIQWKGEVTSSAVPTYSKPVVTNSGHDNGTAFKARPIKHYRKQLMPTNGSAFSRASIGMPMDRPGGATSLAINSSLTNISCIKDDIQQDPACDLNGITPCPPQFLRSASTILSKKYYTDSRAYLRSRCQLYDQKLSANPVIGITYIGTNGLPLYPTDQINGPQVRNTQNCSNNCSTTVTTPGTTIYKPNNRVFSREGGVEASAQTLRLNVNVGKSLNPPLPLNQKNWPLLKTKPSQYGL